MSQITHVFVSVTEGRLVPIPAGEAAGAGGSTLRLEPGKVYRLPWSTYTRRRINAGDLYLVNQGGTKVADAAAARADADVKVDHDGVIAKDQRADEVINAEAAKAAELDAAKALKARAFDTTDTNGKDRS